MRRASAASTASASCAPMSCIARSAALSRSTLAYARQLAAVGVSRSISRTVGSKAGDVSATSSTGSTGLPVRNNVRTAA